MEQTNPPGGVNKVVLENVCWLEEWMKNWPWDNGETKELNAHVLPQGQYFMFLMLNNVHSLEIQNYCPVFWVTEILSFENPHLCLL